MRLLATYAKFTGPDPIQNSIEAAAKIRADFSGFDPAQVVFFSGVDYDGQRLAAEMRQAFPGAITFGCTSSGEIANGVMLRQSVAAMAFDRDTFDIFEMIVLPHAGPDRQLNDPAKLVDDAFAGFSARLGVPSMDNLDYSKYLFMVFADGSNYFIEPIMERAGDLTSVPFFGGMAGNDLLDNKCIQVFLNGEAHRDAAVLALIKPKYRFAVLKTEGLVITDRAFTITDSDYERRLLKTLDDRPAIEVYAEAIGTPVPEITMEKSFAQWPVGIMVGDEPFLRFPMKALPDGSMEFGHAIREGCRLKLCRLGGTLASTARALADMEKKLGGIAGILHVNCMLRHRELEELGQLEEFGDLFKGYPNAGFSSHGEIYISIANMTSTMLVFAKD
ncbi:MAG: FIST C-terminal domain-containing protein [Planctomycetota bacterium]|jgi:hypothetical protein|nr:FIST C-terminal domain-containing protein [Planctomycetota bacterium]